MMVNLELHLPTITHGAHHVDYLAHKGLKFRCHGYVGKVQRSSFPSVSLEASRMSQPPSVVVELTTDVNSTVEHLQELGEHMAPSPPPLIGPAAS